MTTPKRHDGAPYRGGETLFGAQLETDIDNLYDAFNGQLDNGNFSPDAGITSAQILDASITTAKLDDGSVTGDKLADDAITTVKIKDASLTALAFAVGAFASAYQGYSDSDVTLTGSDQECAAVSFTTGPGSVAVLLLAQIEWLLQTINRRTLVTLKRDSTTLVAFQKIDHANFGRTVLLPFCWVDTGFSDDTAHTYYIYAKQNTTTGTASVVQQATITALEFRR